MKNNREEYIRFGKLRLGGLRKTSTLPVSFTPDDARSRADNAPTTVFSDETAVLSDCQDPTGGAFIIRRQTSARLPRDTATMLPVHSDDRMKV